MFDIVLPIMRVISLLIFLLFCFRVVSDAYRCKKSGNWLVRILKSVIANPESIVIFTLTPFFFYYTIIVSSESVFVDLKLFVVLKSPNFVQLFQETIGFPLAMYIALEMAKDIWKRNQNGYHPVWK